MNASAGLALAGCLGIGAVLGFSLLEFGIFGIFILPATVLALLLLQGGKRTRLLRIGAILIGAGLGGSAPLLALVARIGNICGGAGVALGAGTLSYECYSIETIWALIAYGVIACLGIVLLVAARRRSTRRSPAAEAVDLTGPRP